MLKRADFEIMAPVGSYESLMAAIKGGADSVYFGIEKMNMRAHSSNNFTFNDLENIVGICNENNIKTYLTINTVVYDTEITLMRDIIDAAKKNKITAIIASDMAVINYARKVGVEVHISTQLNVSNIESLRFFAQFADVIVRLSSMLRFATEIKEMDINPLFGKEDSIVAVDARIRIEHPLCSSPLGGG